MSGLSHFRVVVFFPRVFSIVPCHYGQVSGVKVWLARKKVRYQDPGTKGQR